MLNLGSWRLTLGPRGSPWTRGGYLGAMEPHPGALEAHPGALGADPGSMEAYYKTQKISDLLRTPVYSL
jgi:hypothetical protein